MFPCPILLLVRLGRTLPRGCQVGLLSKLSSSSTSKSHTHVLTGKENT